MGREKYGEAKKKLMIQSIPRYTSNMVGASDIAWACMAASITGSLVFIDDATANRSSTKHFMVTKTLLQKQPERFPRQRNRTMFNAQVSQPSRAGFSVTKDKTEFRKIHKQTATEDDCSKVLAEEKTEHLDINGF